VHGKSWEEKRRDPSMGAKVIGELTVITQTGENKDKEKQWNRKW
jgi:hypothetical protein